MRGARVPEDVRALYRRMRLIPSWDYERCAGLDVALVGLGGLGSAILQLLLLLGIGERGRTVLIDADTIEPSNRSRIPYATPADDGALKVDVAVRYARAVRPGREVYAVAQRCVVAEAQEAIAASDLVIGAVDSELARVAMNHLAYAFCLPYVDGGAGILLTEVGGEPLVCTGGQVRIVVPDQTPCLLCNLGVEREAVDREWLRQVVAADAGERAVLERSGYIRGLDAGAEQPSAAHLNAVVASALVTVVLGYLLTGLPDYHALHVDLGQLEWTRSIATRRPECPVCGAGEVGHGRYWELADLGVRLALGPGGPADA